MSFIFASRNREQAACQAPADLPERDCKLYFGCCESLFSVLLPNDARFIFGAASNQVAVADALTPSHIPDPVEMLAHFSAVWFPIMVFKLPNFNCIITPATN